MAFSTGPLQIRQLANYSCVHVVAVHFVTDTVVSEVLATQSVERKSCDQ